MSLCGAILNVQKLKCRESSDWVFFKETMTSTDTLPAASSLKIDKHALTVQLFGEPLTSTMNKYTRENVRQDLDASGVILMLAHGLGFCEYWWSLISQCRADNCTCGC